MCGTSGKSYSQGNNSESAGKWWAMGTLPILPWLSVSSPISGQATVALEKKRARGLQGYQGPRLIFFLQCLEYLSVPIENHEP